MISSTNSKKKQKNKRTPVKSMQSYVKYALNTDIYLSTKIS